MSDPIQGGLAAEMRCIPVQDRADRTFVVIVWDRFIGEPAAFRINDREARRGTYPGDLAVDARSERAISGGLEHREFDARRTGVDDEDRFMHSLQIGSRARKTSCCIRGSARYSVIRPRDF